MLVVGWATLAVYYQMGRSWLAIALALTILALGIWGLWLARSPRPPLLFAAALAVVLMWWSTIAPSHDRDWRPEVAQMPRASIDGDRVHFTGFRNFDYRSADDFTVRYEERDVSISDLVAVDFFVSYWMPGPFGHTFVSFVFANSPPVNVSIETRTEIGEGFDPLASLFKEFDLIYVVGDERDIVGVRTNHRGEDVYMYRIKGTPEGARRLFMLYLDRINSLADNAEWYHLVSNSCTINVVRYARALTPIERFNPRFYLNGLIDRFLYSARLVDTSVPFRELRERARITDDAQAAGEPADFYQRIRQAALQPGPVSLR
ncbi:MAG TPA: DUF4105 domain-containing protein [Gammaproteobacteria bacterium]